MSRPLRIGISACFFHADPTRPVFKGKTLVYAEESMLDLVGRSGALTYLIPRIAARADGAGPSIADYVDDLDGLVLEGGSDVCPRSYGERPLRPEWEGDEARDRYEIELIHAFHDAGKPVLGICRGAQILNVAFGGTLYQDITTQVEGSFEHRNWEIYDTNLHEVHLAAGSHLADLYGVSGPGATVVVNSVHHQSVKDPAPGFEVEAVSVTDGIIEALRRPGAPFIAAVQWHPEFTPVGDTDQLAPDPLVADFLAACVPMPGIGAELVGEFGAQRSTEVSP
ncbi:MAG TPA: gamma-glutamyl-gamma-aminobutyrate hydrolase family protein [Acidimicrobiales bacterium]